jgi:ribosomal protein S18 acetylase RimI-like enzyme
MNDLEKGLFLIYSYRFLKNVIGSLNYKVMVHDNLKLSICGDVCSECPRYLASVSNDLVELGKIAELWYRLGFRDEILSPEELRCSGCSKDKFCSHGINTCQQLGDKRNCGECANFPCEKINQVFLKTEAAGLICKERCSDKEYNQLGRAFLFKKEILTKINDELRSTEPGAFLNRENLVDIEKCTMDDFNQIIRDISDFWGSDRTLHLHQSYLIHEFGNTAFVIRDYGMVIAYMFGFFSQMERIAYVHLIGVRGKYQKHGLGKKLYDNFIQMAKAHQIQKIKAITKPINTKSINFHKSKIGMVLLGEPNENGINVIKDYSGIGEDRVVFERMI